MRVSVIDLLSKRKDYIPFFYKSKQEFYNLIACYFVPGFMGEVVVGEELGVCGI